MKKNSITNKITPCCGLPFSVIYWWVSNLTLNSESDRKFILSKISQNGIISIDGWKVLVNSGTLEADASLTKADFLAWFNCGNQPTCEQLKLIIEGFKIGNWTPETELPPNVALIDKIVNGKNLKGNVYTKEQIDEKESRGLKGILKISDPKPAPDAIGKYELADIGEYTNLVPIIPSGSITAQNTPITTEDGYYNAVYFDGAIFTQIKMKLPTAQVDQVFNPDSTAPASQKATAKWVKIQLPTGFEIGDSTELEDSDSEFEIDWVKGAYINLSAQNVIAEPRYMYAKHIDLLQNTEIYVSGVFGLDNGIFIYDNNGVVLKRIDSTVTGNNDSQTLNFKIDIPEGGSYMSFSTKIDAVNRVSKPYKRITKSFEEFYQEFLKSIRINGYGYEDLFKTINWVPGEKINSIDGTFFADYAWKRSDFIAVKKGDRFKVNLRGDNFACLAVFYPEKNTNNFEVIANFENTLNVLNKKIEIVIEKEGFVVFQTRTLDYYVDDLYIKKYNPSYSYYSSLGDFQNLLKQNGLLRNYFEDNISIEKPTEIFLTGEMPQDASENRVATQLAFSLRKNGIEICKGFTNLAIQGHGSASYLKKGYTFDVLNESGNSMKIKFGDMISADSFHLKAYATDSTHTRDVGNNRIWRDMINFLDYPQSKVNNMGIGLSLTTNENEAYNQDAKYYTEGFPVRVFLNGVFFGLYTMRNKKTRENYSLNNKNKNHIFLDSATYTAYLKESFDPTDWEIKSPKMTGYVDGGIVPDTTVLTNINRLFDFTRNLTTTYQNHADFIVLNHWVTWVIFSEVISNRDTNGNNYNLMTWDGTHWSIIPYDLDLTLGLNPWDNRAYTVELSRKKFDINHDIWATFKTVYITEIKAMYTKLRNNGFLTVSNLSKYYREIGTKINRNDYINDAKIWGNIWSNSIPTVEQIDLFLKNKIEFLDTKWL